MRVSNYLKDKILTTIYKSFGKCEVILFGSRVDDNKSGGDFDIAIKSNLSKEEFKKAKIAFFKEMILSDLDLPIDLIDYNHVKNSILKNEIDKKGVKLIY
jgi:predicted nucleotidyltransferase